MPMNAAKLLLLNVLGGSAPSFSPLDIPGLALWLDASDSTTLFQDSAGTTPATADNDVVGCMSDKSGNGYHAVQVTTANKPLLKLAQQNGKSVVRFDGVNDNMLANFGATISQPGTLLFAFNPKGSSANYLCDGVSPLYRWALYSIGGVHMYAGTGFSTGFGWPSQMAIATAVFNGASSIARRNGAQTASGNAGTNSLTGLTIAGRVEPGSPLTVDIAELLLYTGALSTPNIEALEAYLNAKWGVY